MNTDRDEDIDTLKGIACIAVVMYHVIGETPLTGLRMTEGFLRDVNTVLVYLHMPVFAFLSGLLYARKPFSGRILDYITAKFLRLIVPMLTVGTGFAVLQSIANPAHLNVHEWYLLHIVPVGHFWFLEALFIVFMLMIPFERFKIFDNKRNFAILGLLSAALYACDVTFNYFSVSGAVYLMPYFLAGIAVRKFRPETLLSFYPAAALLLGVAGILFLVASGIISNPGPISFPGLVLGLCFCLSLFMLRPKNKFAAIVGEFSYTIYLYHVFFTAGIRIILQRFGIEDIAVLFCAGLFAGIVGPIYVDRFFSGYDITRIGLLGKKPLVPPGKTVSV